MDKIKNFLDNHKTKLLQGCVTLIVIDLDLSVSMIEYQNSITKIIKEFLKKLKSVSKRKFLVKVNILYNDEHKMIIYDELTQINVAKLSFNNFGGSTPLTSSILKTQKEIEIFNQEVIKNKYYCTIPIHIVISDNLDSDYFRDNKQLASNNISKILNYSSKNNSIIVSLSVRNFKDGIDFSAYKLRINNNKETIDHIVSLLYTASSSVKANHTNSYINKPAKTNYDAYIKYENSLLKSGFEVEFQNINEGGLYHEKKATFISRIFNLF